MSVETVCQLLVTLFAAGGIVWRMGQLAGVLNRLERDVVALDKRMEKFEQFESVVSRLDSFERTQLRHTSDIKELLQRQAESAGYRKAMASRPYEGE